MRNGRILGGLVFAVIGAIGVKAFAAPPETQTHPSELFKQYCAKCHGDDGKAQTAKGRSLKARDFTDAEWQADQKDSELIEHVTEGKDDMPPFGKKLTPEQIDGLVKNDVRGFAPKKN
jgi:mono/diheme cytochrome c family protein